MYLALIPDDKSIEALRRFAPSLPNDVHATIIHAKRELDGAALPLPPWPVGDVPLQCGTAGLQIFGGKVKVRVLKLYLSGSLRFLRGCAESILRDAGIAWSAEWPFAPHVTLGGVGDLIAKEVPPTTLAFDRMEWR